MKKFISILFFLLMLAQTALGAEAANETIRYEGPGFNTPEEAALAYLDALKVGDVDGMISTFSIETYVDHFDVKASLEWLKSYSYSSYASTPTANEYIRQIKLVQRVAEISDAMYLSYLQNLWPEAYGNIGSPVRFTEDGSLDAFLAVMTDADKAALIHDIEFVDFAEPTALSSTYSSERNQANIQKAIARYGCDELCDVAAYVTRGGELYLFTMQCARYGDVWYNQSFFGSLSNLLGLDSASGGFIAAGELE